MKEMTDEELLGYASIHCRSEVGAFHRKHIQRIMDLAGEELKAPQEWFYLGPDQLDPYITRAWATLKKQQRETARANAPTELKLHPSIRAAVEARDIADENLEKAITTVQKTCTHGYVLERRGYRLSEHGSYFLPRRMCAVCGYEEEAWHWPGYINGKSPMTGTILNTETPHVVGEEIYQYRPGTPLKYRPDIPENV